MRAQLAGHDRITVRRGALHAQRRDRAAAAGNALNDDRLSKGARDGISNGADNRVRWPAGRKGDKHSILNKRASAYDRGVLLIGAGVVALLPTLTGYTSLDGTVNAPLGMISAPIEGVVTSNPPKVGSFLPSGEEVVGIRNDRIATAAEAQIETDLAATRERLKALREQIGKLADLKQKLQVRLQEYQQASIRNVMQEIAVRQHRISSAAAQRQSADADLARKERLGTSGIVAGSSEWSKRARPP
jgi:hypothetical protein